MTDHLLLTGYEPRISRDTGRTDEQGVHTKAASGTRRTVAGRKADVKKAAQEMESLFAYQLLKTMRETSKSLTGESPGAGYDTYMGLFDMEVSKIMAERGMGLQDAILKWLDSAHESADDERN